MRVIRPFVYVREKSLREFAESRRLPVIPENCPACFEAPTERHRVKQLLANQEIIFPGLFLSLRSAIQPLMVSKNENIRVISNYDTKNNPDLTDYKICCLNRQKTAQEWNLTELQ